MEYRILGRTGLNVSSIGMGCVTFGREIDRDTSFAVMDRALERGINLFDTAPVYGDGASESILGEWMAERGTRDNIVLCTKASLPLDPGTIRTRVEESLRRLRVEIIDLLKLHAWDPDVPLEETLEALEGLVHAGKVRFVGCSNFTGEQLQQALDIQAQRGYQPMGVIQPMYNLVHREAESDLFPICAKENIGVVSYSPLGAGFLTGKYRPRHPLPKGTRFDIRPWQQDIYFSDHGFNVVDNLRSLSEEVGVSMVQLALAWVLHQPGITSVLVGARGHEHVDQAFEAEALDVDPTWFERFQVSA